MLFETKKLIKNLSFLNQDKKALTFITYDREQDLICFQNKKGNLSLSCFEFDSTNELKVYEFNLRQFTDALKNFSDKEVALIIEEKEEKINILGMESNIEISLSIKPSYIPNTFDSVNNLKLIGNITNRQAKQLNRIFKPVNSKYKNLFNHNYNYIYIDGRRIHSTDSHTLITLKMDNYITDEFFKINSETLKLMGKSEGDWLVYDNGSYTRLANHYYSIVYFYQNRPDEEFLARMKKVIEHHNKDSLTLGSFSIDTILPKIKNMKSSICKKRILQVQLNDDAMTLSNYNLDSSILIPNALNYQLNNDISFTVHYNSLLNILNSFDKKESLTLRITKDKTAILLNYLGYEAIIALMI